MKVIEHDSIVKLIHEAEQWIEETGSSYNISQIKELHSQYHKHKWNIACCGHFSAGKSSFINQLCGREMLPAGPIPTTANIIRIEHGKEQITLYQRDSNENLVVKHSLPGTIQQLRSYTTDNTEYDVVKVEAPIPAWGDQIVFIDTPGADSTDERHHQATARVLPLSDLVLYITDYNHVLSEVNMKALQQLQKMGKWFLFIVNQVDKHRDQEMTFHTFKETVRVALKEWEVSPHSVWYVSAKQPNHPLSEWKELKEWLASLRHLESSILNWTTAQSLRSIVKHHQMELDQRLQLQKEEMENEQGISFETLEDEINKWKTAITEAEALPQKKETELKQEVSKLLQNANIIPASTRDFAHDFLQTRKPGFKKGWILSKKKTEQEQQRVLKNFHKSLQENVRTQIEWHIKDLLKQALEKDQLSDASIMQQMEQLSFDVTPDWLMNQIQSGVVFSHEYTMTYTNKVSEAMKAKVKQQVFMIIEQAKKEWEKQSKKIVNNIKQQMEQGQRHQAEYEQWKMLHEKQQQLKDEAERFLHVAYKPNPQLPPKPDVLHRDGQTKLTVHDDAHLRTGHLDENSVQERKDHSDRSLSQADEPTNIKEIKMRKYEWKHKNEETSNRLQQAAELLAQLPHMKETAARMRSKGDRLRNSQFTVALFGAFSAGKSSFANALIGHSILAVSPHPTTAAITRILAPTKHVEHGTAVIQLKTMEQLQEEVKQAFFHMGLMQEKVDLAEWIKKPLPNEVGNEAARRARAFLNAVQRGWPELEGKLGQTIHTTIEQFRRFSADEIVSVYVSSIDVYYSSPLTNAGVILVDTPGADSLNARHTGVAFEYIKNADAIIFVTYFNHAFTQADRLFLEQLGRVKDQFSMDKMFFIVNAADLAANDEELEQVIQHVKHNLEKSDIRNPHLYPISSIQALQAKEQNDWRLFQQCGMLKFEEEWMQFMQEEIGAISAHAAQYEIENAVSLLDQWLEEAEGKELERKQKREQWLQAKKEVQQLYDSISCDWLYDQLDREIKELMFYVKQRVQFRYGDWFKASFHPSLLSNQPKNHVRASLLAAMNECSHYINQSCLQEAFATSLRIENFITKAWQDWDKQLLEKFDPLFDSFTGEQNLDGVWESPKLDDRMEPPAIDDKWLIQHFQNAKAFFEQGGRERMRIELEKHFMASVDTFIDQLSAQLKEHYFVQLDNKLHGLLREREKMVVAYVESWIDILGNPADRSTMITIRNKLQEI